MFRSCALIRAWASRGAVVVAGCRWWRERVVAAWCDGEWTRRRGEARRGEESEQGSVWLFYVWSGVWSKAGAL